MKILVLNNDLTERSVIQQVLQRNGHQVVAVSDSQSAWNLLQDGSLRFVIADRTNTDMDEQRFIERVCMKALGMAKCGSHCFDTGTAHIVEGILFGKAPSRSLAMGS